jgi:hypothetical protein
MRFVSRFVMVACASAVFAAAVLLPVAHSQSKDQWEKLGSPIKGKLIKIQGATYIVQMTTQVPQLTGNPPRLQLKELKKDFHFRLTEDCAVRLPEPPMAFDSQGNIKRYTAAELSALKGPNKTLPGYTGDVADLRPGMFVQVQAVRKKETQRGIAPPKVADDEPLLTNFIVVLANAAEPKK